MITLRGSSSCRSQFRICSIISFSFLLCSLMPDTMSAKSADASTASACSPAIAVLQTQEIQMPSAHQNPHAEPRRVKPDATRTDTQTHTHTHPCDVDGLPALANCGWMRAGVNAARAAICICEQKANKFTVYIPPFVVKFPQVPSGLPQAHGQMLRRQPIGAPKGSNLVATPKIQAWIWYLAPAISA